MKTSPNGVARLKRYESCVLTIYKDSAGLDTIGYGHLLTSSEKANKSFADGISQSQAELLLILDMKPAEDAVNKFVTATITQDQFDSLVSFTFNCGTRALQMSSMLKSINAGAPADEIKTNLLKWNKITDPKTGKLVVSKGLHNRRLDEAKAW